ncbi:MAG TPA: T9SS type A sorting domain-containing protein [Saprospiraceae bacterium]|nr:T9SS type A sorting domain-containing protein [Saprospiraceae bacterium]
MKRMLLASALSALCLSSMAQITITNATFPAVGDSLVYSLDQDPLGVNPATPPGGPQIWDFTALQIDDESSVVYRPAASGNQVANFPGADLMVGGQTGETYFNLTAQKFEVLGYAGGDPTGFGLNVVAKFLPSVVERKAPLNFFDINQQSTNLVLPFSTEGLPDSLFQGAPFVPDSIRIRISTERLEVVDGFGTCQIPGGTYPVLRQKRTEYTTTGMDIKVPFLGWVDLSTIIGGGGGGGGIGGFIGTDTTITYRFLSNTEKEDIAVATMSADLSTVVSMRYKQLATTPVIEPVVDFSGSIQAFPNPAVEWVRFDCTNITPGEYTLKIFNILGKQVWKKNYTLSGTTSFRLDLDDFKKGTYIYSLVDKAGNSVGTKRLVILKP